MSALLQFVHTSRHDMHVRCWLHRQAELVTAAVPRNLDGYSERRNVVVERMRDRGVPERHRRYVGGYSLALLGHGGGL